MSNWRFIDSPTLSPKENMELDKSLLESDKPTFRLYTWEKNSFSIGRSQNIEDIRDREKLGTNWTKRVTGGGILLHGCDLSYSITIPNRALGSRSVKESYEYLCSFLLHFYKSLGLHVEYAKDTSLNLSKSEFCQVGFEPYDIICQNKKLGGNAQRRTKNMLLQHGSIPLKKDFRDFSGYSLDELKIDIDDEKAKKILKDSFMQTILLS